jgi:predicted acyl esterase
VGREQLRYAVTRLRGIARPPVRITDPPAGIRFDHDVEVAVRDGTILRVNVFRPEGEERVPVIMCAHPYGKDKLPRPTRRGYRPDFQYRLMRQPGPVTFSALTTWESPDPAWWTAHGYAVVNCDLRGCGSSDGEGSLLSKQEGEDYHDLIQWAGAQPWSTGRVGLLGVSYLALSQYRAAAERPPYLAAICPWEGFSDAYRDLMYPGGVREDGFVRMWSRGVRRQRVEPEVRSEQLAHPLLDDAWREMIPDLERIEAPMLVCASFSDHNLHSRGSFRAFERAGSPQKWLYTHRGGKWATFYSAAALAAQQRFFDHFLKGEENGMPESPPVRLEIREDRDTVHQVREESEWPLARTEWTELHLHPGGRLERGPAEAERTKPFGSTSRAGADFSYRFDRETELSGPMSLRLHVEVRGADDVNLFVAVDKLRDGRRVPFEGSYGFGLDQMTHGWLKASHREVDRVRSRPFEPVHTHASATPLGRGEIAELEIALLPSATLFRAGEELRVTIRGRWPWRRNPLTGQMPAAYEPSPKATCVLHLGGRFDSRMLVPVIPPR